jgi:hypothetical protein
MEVHLPKRGPQNLNTGFSQSNQSNQIKNLSFGKNENILMIKFKTTSIKDDLHGRRPPKLDLKTEFIVAHAKGGPRFPSAHARTINSPPPP